MTRLLLTLLALLTGLVAQTAPAATRVGGAVGAEVTIQLPGSSKRAAIVSQAARRPANAECRQLCLSSFVTPQRIAPVPTVLTGIDRARE